MTTPLLCPSCDANRVVPVLYGEPSVQPANDERIGGCVLAVDSPRWCCRACGHLWGLLEVHDFGTGVLAKYDFDNLATRLELAIESAMWSRVAHHQFEALEIARSLLERVRFADELAEGSRLAVTAILGTGATEAGVDALTETERETLAQELLHLLRYAERKAANG